MDEKELQKLFEGLADKNRQAIKTEVEAVTKGLLTIEEFNKRIEPFGENSKKVDQLTKALETQGEEIRKFFQSKDKDTTKTLDEILQEHSDSIRGLRQASKSGRDNVKITLSKATIEKALVTRATVQNNTTAYRVPGIGQLAITTSIISTLFRHVNVGENSGGVIRYLDQDAVTRGAAPVAEGAIKPESAISWIERLAPIEKIADSIPVTKEAWNDLAFVKSEIEALLNTNIALKIDQQLYSGTGISPELKGVYTTAPLYAGTGFNDTIEQANIADLAMILAADISAGKTGKYVPNTVLVNPTDSLRFKLIKTIDGIYNTNPFVANGNLTGMQIVESSQVLPNTLLVGDFRYGTIYDLEGFTIEMGWINDQFIRNQMTILAEQRLMLLIKTIDADAFRKVADVSTVLAALEKEVTP
jgi:HK97 family phage major capsid protein